MLNTLNQTLGTARNVVESAKEGTEHAISSARSTWLDGVKAVTGIVRTVRGFGLEDGLGLIGLARRRSPLGAVAAFGAGVVAGAGLGVLFAPRSGAATRRAMWKQLRGLGHEAMGTLEHAESEVGAKAEELAGKAKQAVKNVERTMEDRVSAGADAAKEAVRSTVDAATGAVKEKVEEVTSVIRTAADHATSSNGGEAKKSARSPGGTTSGYRPS